MVTWVGDGGIVGYNPSTNRLTNDLFKFTTDGVTVDLNGATRLQYPFRYAGNGAISKTTYPNTLRASATFTITSGDISSNPGKRFTAMLLAVKATAFPAGVVPTPAQLWAVPDSELLFWQTGSHYRDTAGSLSLTIMGDPNHHEVEYPANTKMWVLVTPVVHTYSVWNPTPARSSFTQPVGSPVSARGRALSLWTNRTPTAPTITSPANNSEHTIGSEFVLSYQPGDPDRLIAPDDGQRFNRDVAGVQFQYAAAPTEANPEVEWKPLPYEAQHAQFDNLRPSEAAFLRHDSFFLGGKPGFYYDRRRALVDQLGTSVHVGSDVPTGHGGKAVLPGGGEWLIRVRTFDWGHPYPNEEYLHQEVAPGPIGVNAQIKDYVYPFYDVWPVENTSPWSAPIKVKVPVQVPPPVPLSPINDRAVPYGDSVKMTWQYRNTHANALPQLSRRVEVRKATDPDWTQVIAGLGSDNFVLLPPSWNPPAGVPTPVEQQSAVGFETGTLEGWSVVDYGDYADRILGPGITGPGDFPAPPVGLTPTVLNNSGVAQEGDYSVELNIARSDWENTTSLYLLAKIFPVSALAGYTHIGLSGWALPTVSAVSSGEQILLGGLANIRFLDASGSFNEELELFGSGVALDSEDVVPDTWYNLSVDPIRIPTAASYVIVIFGTGTAPQVSDNTVKARLDDIRITLSHDFTQEPFELEVGNPYEWRVRVEDSTGVSSDWSQSGRFWVVPAGGSGDVKPTPENTIDGATLGCGTHRAFIYRRGGRQRVGEITGITHLDWSRVRDDISTAEIVVEKWDLDCGNLLSALKCWAYELVIYRDNGATVDRVWEGPITLLTYENDRVVIDAKDVMGYAYRRILKEKMSDAGKGNGTTVVDRARRVLQSALASDDPNVLPYLNPIVSGNDAMQYRSTPAYSRTAFEEVDDMAANSGLDYTCAGRSILLWGTKNRVGTLPEFRDKDLGALPIVSEYGMSMANFYAVSDGNGVYGSATRLVDDKDDFYGRVEMLSSTWASDSEVDTGTYTQEGRETVIESFKGYAERSIDSRYPPPVVVRVPDNTTVSPDAVVSIQSLIPGVIIPLRSKATLRTVVALQKLDSVRVVEEGGTETISITLSPFSRDDASTEEEGT